MSDTLRTILARSLDWKDAHATFDDAVANFPPELRGVRVDDVPWPAWQLVEHIAAIRAGRAALKRLAEDDSIDLTGATPHGSGSQTYARAILLVVDHNAYHVGQIVLLRRLLGAWT